MQHTEGGKTVAYENFEQGLTALFVEAPSPSVLSDGFLKQISKCSERPFYDVFTTAELADAAKRSEAQKAAADAQAKADKNDPRAEASPAAAMVAISSATGNDYKFGFMSAPAYCAAFTCVSSQATPMTVSPEQSRKRDASSVQALIQRAIPASSVASSTSVASPEAPRLG